MKTFNLTYSQAKTLINDLGRDTVETFVNDLDDQPKFLEYMGEIEDVAELISIYGGGCASGAYMPAVTYYKAKQCLFEHEESLLAQIEHFETIEWNLEQETLGGIAAKICSMAVEDYVQQFSEVIEVLMTCYY